MNNVSLSHILNEEHKDIEAPACIKDAVSQSIGYLCIVQSLIELYGSMLPSVLDGFASKKEDTNHYY